MTLAIILVVAAALALLLILRVALSRNLQISTEASLAGQIQPIDVAAFRNLIDPAEDAYLRRRLPASQFRKVQRERLRATACYIQIAGKNATVLIRMGQKALAANDARTMNAARQLVDNALLLRRNATFALFRIYVAMIYVAMAWPNRGRTGAAWLQNPVLQDPVLRDYERLNGTAMLLGRLQNPAAPLRIAATM
jgi:hypothetical protein